MEILFSRQLEYTLRGSLREYGLNPNEWSVDFSQLRVRKNSSHELGIENIMVRNREDQSISFLGLAKAKVLGPVLKAKWQSLSFLI